MNPVPTTHRRLVPLLRATLPGAVALATLAAAANPFLDDPTFRSAGGVGPATLEGISSLALFADGRMVVGGNFTSYDGSGRPGIAIVRADGRLDPAFQPAVGPNRQVYAVGIQSAQQVLIAGPFSTYNGFTVPYLARLRGDGSLDTDFAPNYQVSGNSISSLLVLPDGKVLVAGDCTWFTPGLAWQKLARLDPNGTLDTTFARSGNTFEGGIATLARQADGKILIGGLFNTPPGTYPMIARLNSDGSVDPTFQQPKLWQSDASNVNGFFVGQIAVAGDGKIVVGGAFSAIDGYARHNLARLNADGSLDTSFNPPESELNIQQTLAVQRDGKVIVSQRRSGDGLSYSSLLRLLPDGRPDPDLWMRPLTGAILTVVIHPDGRLITAGNGSLAFPWRDGVVRRGLWRLLPYYFSHITATPDGTIQLRLVGESSRHYVVRASEDGTQWNTWTNFISSSAISTLTDREHRRSRFYQVGQLPE